MAVLILGGTGAIGSSLVEVLELNNSIYVTSRSYKEDRGEVSYIKGNAMDVKFLEKVLKICHWDCIIDFMAYSVEQFEERIDLILKSTLQYIFLSSSRVYNFDFKDINEESYRQLDVSRDKKYILSNDYALEKAREEDILYKNILKNWTIVRPYKTYSKQRLQLGFLEKESWMYRCLQGRSIVFSKDLASKYTSLSYSYDVAQCIKFLIGNSNTFGETYQIVTGETISWGQVLMIYLSAIEEFTGKRPNVIWGKNAYQIWKGCPDYTIEYDSLKDHYFCNKKMEDCLEGVAKPQFCDTETGLRECIKNFLLDQNFQSINWIQEAHFDKLTHEHASMKEIMSNKNKIIYILIRYTQIFSFIKICRKIKYKRIR